MNKIIGIAIKPEKETAFAIEEISFKIKVAGLTKYWKMIRKERDIKIE